MSVIITPPTTTKNPLPQTKKFVFGISWRARSKQNTTRQGWCFVVPIPCANPLFLRDLMNSACSASNSTSLCVKPSNSGRLNAVLAFRRTLGILGSVIGFIASTFWYGTCFSDTLEGRIFPALIISLVNVHK